MLTHGVDATATFKWRVLTIIKDRTLRLATEALYIRSMHSKMNGCEGTFILPFLQSWI